MKLNDLIRALYIGYEVEKTPEEKVKEYYETLCHNGIENKYTNGALHSLKKTLDLLDIKIEGVNI